MSDIFLIFVPNDPDFVFTGDAQQLVGVARQHFPEADDVKFHAHESAQFIDQGQNFDDVKCPECGGSLMERFGSIMDGAYDDERGGFVARSFATPCCGATTSLERLKFEMPAAFGKSQLDVMNPNVAEIAKADHRSINEAFGTQTQVVWSRV